MTAQFYYKSDKKKRYFLLRVITMFWRMPPNTTTFFPSSMATVFDISIIIGVMIGVLFNSVEYKYA